MEGDGAMTENIKHKHGVEAIIEPFTRTKSFEVIDPIAFFEWLCDRFDHERLGGLLDAALRDEWQTAYEEDLIENEGTNGGLE